MENDILRKVLNEPGLWYFFTRFVISSLMLVTLFNLTFPYYRSLLLGSVRLLTRASQEDMARVSLVIMPYVSISAIALSTARRTAKERLVFVIVLFALFYLTDIMFALVHLYLQDIILTKSQILLVQDFLTIAIPVVSWAYFYFDDLSNLGMEKSI